MTYSKDIPVRWLTHAVGYALRRAELSARDLQRDLGYTTHEARAVLQRLIAWQIVTRLPGATRPVVRISCRYERMVCRALVEHDGVVPEPNPLEPLLVPAASARQREVLLLFAEANNRQEIADKLCISRDTVKTHLQRLYRLLDARSSPANLVHQAYQQGLLPAPHIPAPSGKDSPCRT